MWHREGEEAQDTRWVPNSSRSRIQTPGSGFQVQGAFQHLKPLRKPPASPTHLAQPGLSGLQVRDLESKAQIPHVLSGQLWTVAALRPPGWGEEQACKSAALPCSALHGETRTQSGFVGYGAFHITSLGVSVKGSVCKEDVLSSKG